MNKARAVGILTSLLALVGLIYVLASDSQTPVIQWPYEAFQGLVFTLGWGFGVPANMSYLVSAVLVIVVLVVFYLIGHTLARCVLNAVRK